MSEIRCKITNNKYISAIYFALLQCGYEYCLAGRSPEHEYALKPFASKEMLPFFAEAKQNICEAYPYWPRAALLETACFYIDVDLFVWKDFESYKKRVMNASNITEEERNDMFWEWVYEFPQNLKTVIQTPLFNSYLEWEHQWTARQNENYKDELSVLKKRIEYCAEHYNTVYKHLEILLSPIKCVYSCDHHFVDKTFIFSSGNFSTEGITHEFLHHIIHPIVERNKVEIINSSCDFCEIDPSYYLSGDDMGKLNAFEEQTVRIVTQRFADNIPVENIEKLISVMLK